MLTMRFFLGLLATLLKALLESARGKRSANRDRSSDPPELPNKAAGPLGIYRPAPDEQDDVPW